MPRTANRLNDIVDSDDKNNRIQVARIDMSHDAPKSIPPAGGHSVHADLTSPGVIERLTNFHLLPNVERRAQVLIAIGAITFIGSAIVQPQLLWASILALSFLMVSLGLSGLLMIAMQYLTAAGWSVVLRRISEAISCLLIPGLIGIAAVLIFRPSLYPWMAIEAGEHGFGGFKGFWLNHSSWLIRAAIYAAIWLTFFFAFRMHSRRQDIDGKRSHTRWNIALSAIFVILFSLSYWLASVDWLMSLEPYWFSTMYGVYNFAGLLSGGVACTIVVAVWLRNRGVMRGIITDEHLHDLGKLLLAFTTFWAYIWFSEYMLIWYANIPEETEHYIRRTYNLWKPLFYLNLGLNWVIPFLALLPRVGKRDDSFLIKIALIVLIGRVLDMYMLIVPTVSEATPFAGFAPLGITIGAIGVIILTIGKSLRQAALVPLKDPFLDESLHHHI